MPVAAIRAEAEEVRYQPLPITDTRKVVRLDMLFATQVESDAAHGLV